MTAFDIEKQIAQAGARARILSSYKLSPMQQGMLFHSLYAGQSGMDIEQMVYTLHEQLNVPQFKDAWDMVIARHPILRTSFQWEGMDEPLQHVHSSAELEWDERDWRGWPEERQDEALRDYLRDDRQRGFRLSESTLNRMALFRLGESDYQLIWTFHHAIIDGRSFVLVLEEVFALYEALRSGRALELPAPRPYSDYIEWLDRLDMGAAEEFWRGMLKGFTSPTPLVVNRNSESAFTEHTRYTEQETRLPVAVSSTLKSLAKANGVTLNNMVQGAWALLLSRYSGEEDIVFGATRACRRSTFEGAESIVGPFINTLPMRMTVTANARLMEWLKEIRNYHLSLREYEHTPLMKIQEWSETPRGRSLFDSILVFENYELDSLLRSHGESWANREFELHEQTNYAVALSAWAGPELLLKIAYDRGSIDDTAIAAMLGHLKTLLEGMAAGPNARLSALPMLTERERRQLLVEWNRTEAGYPHTACIHHLFEEQAARAPGAIALVSETARLTYRELNARANRLARHLQSLGVRSDALVGVAMDRSCELIISMLAALKAGGAYIPLDPAYPKERLKEMLDDAQPAVLLTKRPLLDGLPASATTVVCVDSDREAIERNGEEDLDLESSSASLAYVIYTSGSTGRPKGVMIEHRSLVNYTEFAAKEYGINCNDRVLQFASAS
ncbi:MAG TPA: condensation domain-containing protein, partial [Blastocatellia bacterium]